MISKLFGNTEMRRILIYIGAAGTLAIIGGGIYAASISAVTPTRLQYPVTVSSEAPREMPTAAATPTTSRSVERQASVAATGSQPASSTVSIDGHVVQVTIADTPEKRAQGLSGRASLGRNEGMLFVFDTDGQYGMWMKDMRFPVDILWITSDLTIAGFVENATPESYPHAYVPSQPIRYAIELPADWIRSHSIAIGDKIAF